MKPLRTFYIALGSNKGDRLHMLQSALERIYFEVGELQKISGVYETPAWGFSGEAFYNACVAVKSRFSAEQVLGKLLNIENALGRTRLDSKVYQSRTIDLDILLLDEEIINSENLQIPHPQMQERKFVLMPLADIASKELHPKLQKDIGSLLAETPDDSEIGKVSVSLKNQGKNHNFLKCNYIAIEGNIGAGKTSLSTMISQDFNAKLVLERFKDNPFLPKFYEEKNRYAFPLEMSFLADRYQQLSDDLSQYDLFSDFVISDYDVFKSLIFARITLQEDEYILYHKLFSIIYRELVKPDLYIYLYQDTERLLENIKMRGREYEKNIGPEYLIKINKSYLEYIKSQTHTKVRIINISGKDFVNNRVDYLSILEEIDAAL